MEDVDVADPSELRRCWYLVRSRWKLIVFALLLGVSAPLWLLSRQKPTYQATGQVLIRSEQTASLTGLDVNLGEIRSLGAYQKDPLDTQLQVLRSIPVIQSVIERLDLRDSQGKPLRPISFLKQLETEVVRGTDVLKISFTAEEEDITVDAVNALIHAYINNNIAMNRQEATSARLFIEQQLPASEEAVRSAEAQLSQFKYQHGIVTLEKESTQLIETIAQLNRQREDAETQLSEVRARVKKLRARIGLDAAQAFDLSILNESAAVQDTLAKLQATESELAVQKSRYLEQSPTIIQLEDQAGRLKQLLQTQTNQALRDPTQITLHQLYSGPTKQALVASYLNLEIEEKGLENRIGSLSQLSNKYASLAESLPLLGQKQRELQRRLSAAQMTYESLLSKLEEVNAAENQNVENARVIELPTSALRIKNSIKDGLFIGAGGILGTVLGTSIVFLLSAFHRPVRTIQKAREIFNYKLLGVIPVFDHQGKLRDEHYQASSIRLCGRDIRSPVVQSRYKSILNNLLLEANSDSSKVLFLTSSTHGEGKSEVAVNLAHQLSEKDYKVLLIDSNLEQASLHKVWGLQNQTGLTTLLKGEGKFENELETIQENLHLLTSGPSDSQAAQLLSSNKMKSLIDYCAIQYDYVLLDGPLF